MRTNVQVFICGQTWIEGGTFFAVSTEANHVKLQKKCSGEFVA